MLFPGPVRKEAQPPICFHSNVLHCSLSTASCHVSHFLTVRQNHIDRGPALIPKQRGGGGRAEGCTIVGLKEGQEPGAKTNGMQKAQTGPSKEREHF